LLRYRRLQPFLMTAFRTGSLPSAKAKSLSGAAVLTIDF